MQRIPLRRVEGVVRTVWASTAHAAQASKASKAGRDRLIILSPANQKTSPGLHKYRAHRIPPLGC